MPAPQRREVVKELTDAAMAQTAIADALHVSRDTVQRDQDATGCRNRHPDRKVTGKDGKVYKRKPVPDKKPPVVTAHDDFQAAYDNAHKSLLALRATITNLDRAKQASHLLYKYAGIFRRVRRVMDPSADAGKSNLYQIPSAE